VNKPTAEWPEPRHTLIGFERVTLKPGERRTVRMSLSPAQVDILGPGTFEISAGGGVYGNVTNGKIRIQKGLKATVPGKTGLPNKGL